MQSKYARKNTAVEIVCKNCGKRALMKSRKALFCSIECKTAWTNSHRPSQSHGPETTTCEVCGRKFHPFSSRTKFCSKECRTIYFSIDRTARKTANNRIRIGNDKVCEFCGRHFFPKKEKQRFCSEGCYANFVCAQRIADSRGCEVDDDIKNEVINRVRYITSSRTCPICGEQFVPRNERQYCCSTSCGIKYRSRVKKSDEDKNNTQNKVFEFCNEIAKKKYDEMTDFERVSLLPDSERIKVMSTWDRAKIEKFKSTYKKKHRLSSGCSFDIRTMKNQKDKRG